MYTIYTRENCGYCRKAKALMTVKSIPFKEYVLGKDFVREYLKEMYPSQTTYPVILNHQSELIGGFEELEIAIEKGMI